MSTHAKKSEPNGFKSLARFKKLVFSCQMIYNSGEWCFSGSLLTCFFQKSIENLDTIIVSVNSIDMILVLSIACARNDSIFETSSGLVKITIASWSDSIFLIHVSYSDIECLDLPSSK